MKVKKLQEEIERLLTKELLEIIYREKVRGFDLNLLASNGQILKVELKDEVQEDNLHEFCSECKNVFIYYGRGHCISSFIDFDGTWFAKVSGSSFIKSFQGEAEPIAILKACQWVIDFENKLDKIEADAKLEQDYGKR